MLKMKRTFTFCSAVALSFAHAAAADIVHLEETIITDNLLCVGTGCVDGEDDIPGRDGIKIKDLSPTLMFQDTSNAGAGAEVRDWQLAANSDGLGNEDAFYIEDLTEDTTPFTILGGRT